MSPKNNNPEETTDGKGQHPVDVAVGESHEIALKPGPNHLGLADGEHIFSDPDRANYWRGVYEKAHYEGRQRFDPELTWSASAESILIRKVFSKSPLF